MWGNPAYLWPGHKSRSASFENPSAAPSSGGSAAEGRKGAPSQLVPPGGRVVLADLEGPGVVTHFWAVVSKLPLSMNPIFLRSQLIEIFYDGMTEPSVSVPMPDFFGAVHGFPVAHSSSLTAINEGHGFSSRVPMPFDQRIRIEWENTSEVLALLYYQVDLLMGSPPADSGYLHAAFRRENPTQMGRDFVITQGLRGPGRYLGCTAGVRVIEPGHWWGEGEVKIYFDGEELPTICGTGTEDYIDSGWGLGAFSAPESGAPLVLARAEGSQQAQSLVGFYRWHLSDPVVFQKEIRVTLQQIGSASFREGQEAEFAAFKESHAVAGTGWLELEALGGTIGFGLYERSDDWCATSFVYCAEPQAVPRFDQNAASQDLLEMQGHQLVKRPSIPFYAGWPLGESALRD